MASQEVDGRGGWVGGVVEKGKTVKGEERDLNGGAGTAG